MDTKELTKKVQAALSGIELERKPFGKSGLVSFWIEKKALKKAASALKADEALLLDWLENLSAIEIDGSVVLTYFIRSTSSSAVVALRVSTLLKKDNEVVEFDTTSDVWRMAEPFEREIKDLFGVNFKGARDPQSSLLPKPWIGFPLRKKYVFPTEVQSIRHFRPPTLGRDSGLGGGE